MKSKSTTNIDFAIKKLDELFIRVGLGPSIPDNSKVGQIVVKSKRRITMDELEKRAMTIINKRPDKETFLKFLEIKKTDRRKILEMVVENPTMPIHVIATNLLPEY